MNTSNPKFKCSPIVKPIACINWEIPNSPDEYELAWVKKKLTPIADKIPYNKAIANFRTIRRSRASYRFVITNTSQKVQPPTI